MRNCPQTKDDWPCRSTTELSRRVPSRRSGRLCRDNCVGVTKPQTDKCYCNAYTSWAASLGTPPTGGTRGGYGYQRNHDHQRKNTGYPDGVVTGPLTPGVQGHCRYEGHQDELLYKGGARARETSPTRAAETESTYQEEECHSQRYKDHKINPERLSVHQE